jgi:hypothetical protein
MPIKDAAYRAETLHYLRGDYRLAAARLPADLKPIWEDVLLSIEYGQSLRDQWPLMTEMLIFNLAINLAMPGYPRYLLEGEPKATPGGRYIRTLRHSLAQYA